MVSASIVHIVDDEPTFREFLQKSLEAAGFNCETYESGQAFLDRFNPNKPGCVILDLRMPDMDGLTLLQQLRSRRNEMPVIVVSAYADVASTVTVMKLGVIDVVQKPIKLISFFSTVKRALDQSLEMYNREKDKIPIRRRFDELSRRERELLELIVAGLSNKQIASRLHISIKTVANHRASVMTKTGAQNAADLARISLKVGVLEEIKQKHEHGEV